MGWYATEEIDRAVKLYMRHSERSGFTAIQPSRYDSEFDGETVTLRSGGRELARYRVQNGRLRRLAQRSAAQPSA